MKRYETVINTNSIKNCIRVDYEDLVRLYNKTRPMSTEFILLRLRE